MKSKDVKEGMRVVPHSKTAEGKTQGLENSVEWKRALAKGQPFLYVRKVLTNLDCLLSATHKGFEKREYFSVEDFDPYFEVFGSGYVSQGGEVEDLPEVSEVVEKKKCVIRNDKLTWTMHVDGVLIPFEGVVAAEYFRGLYTGLGYEVEFDRWFYSKDDE
jgi:hypothetical protein